MLILRWLLLCACLLGLSGCAATANSSQTPDSSLQSSTDIKEEVPEMQEKEKWAAVLIESLGCTEKRANAALEQLAELGITAIQTLSTQQEEENILRMETPDGKVYLLRFNKRFHLYAIQYADNGNYFYAEYQ